MPKESARLPGVVIGCSFLLGLAMLAPMFCVPPMEYLLKQELNLTHAQTILLYTGPYLMAAVLAIPGGLAGDRIGAKKAAGIGAILIAVGALLRGFSTDATSLLLLTFVYGLGLGWTFPNLPKLVSVWVPPERAGVATGIVIAGQPLGMSLALALTMPVIFPITGSFSGVFFFWGIVAAVAAVLWWTLVKDPPRSPVVNPAPASGRDLLRRALAIKSLWLLSAVILLAEFFFISFIGWAPTLLILKGAAPATAGLASSLAVWVIVANLMLMPRLAFRLGVRKPFIWVPSLVLAGLCGLAIGAPLSASWALMAFAGIANSTRYGTVVALPIQLVPEELVGAASGLILCFGFIGGAVGPYIGGRILDVTGSLDWSLLMLIGLSIATAFIARKLPETGRLRLS